MSGGNRSGGVSSDQKELETTSLELRPIPLLAVLQPGGDQYQPTSNPQHAPPEALKRTVRS